MNRPECCPRCDSRRLAMEGARKSILVSRKDCGFLLEGDPHAHMAELAQIHAEKEAAPAPAPRVPGPDIFLPGVNPWWFR